LSSAIAWPNEAAGVAEAEVEVADAAAVAFEVARRAAVSLAAVGQRLGRPRVVEAAARLTARHR
jgi:CO dehydrogenase/acetyl-CoA synthase epsilon subunit